MRVRNTGGKICSSLETPQTLHADSVTSAPDDMIMAPLWGDRCQGPHPYNWAHPDWHSPAQSVEPSAGRWVLPCVQSQGRKRESRLSSRRDAQSCAVSTLGRSGAPWPCPELHRLSPGWMGGQWQCAGLCIWVGPEPRVHCKSPSEITSPSASSDLLRSPSQSVLKFWDSVWSPAFLPSFSLEFPSPALLA